ncbi:MAG: hypothetical protein RIE77_10500 [Phycisphaerales bacterium]|jgi:ElaB/YqjD/DUF883 family membrane-anchored ribosome-binding protein
MSSNRSSTADPKADVDAIRDDLASLKADVAALINDVAQRGTERATDVAHAATAKAQEMSDAAREQATEAHDRLALEVSQRPLLWLAGAAVAGALIARGVRR